jgi:Ca2+-binding RTX toxin-like protein
MRLRPLALVLAAALLTSGGLAVAKTSHEGWPKIDGVLWLNKKDRSGIKHGTRRNDELLGGHGSDTLFGGAGSDVLWGDYKPGGPAGQTDHIYGASGDEFIYASRGRNIISAGDGDDTIHAHFGTGSIDCGAGTDTLFVSHSSKKRYSIRSCEHLSYKSDG